MNPNNTGRNTLWMMTALALALVPTAAADEEPSSCNNYGFMIQVGLANEYECHAQYCDQGTGAGAGAGAGGPGQNDVGAEASAGTSCRQDDGTGNKPSPLDPVKPALLEVRERLQQVRP